VLQNHPNRPLTQLGCVLRLSLCRCHELILSEKMVSDKPGGIQTAQIGEDCPSLCENGVTSTGVL
jgi:hypothetical protein